MATVVEQFSVITTLATQGPAKMSICHRQNGAYGRSPPEGRVPRHETSGAAARATVAVLRQAVLYPPANGLEETPLPASDAPALSATSAVAEVAGQES